jgi:hypothetical protein
LRTSSSAARPTGNLLLPVVREHIVHKLITAQNGRFGDPLQGTTVRLSILYRTDCASQASQRSGQTDLCRCGLTEPAASARRFG